MACQKPSKAEAFRLRVANRGCDQPLGRTRCALVCLLASALTALGTANASPAQHQKPLSQHRSKAAEAEGHKHGTARDAKRSNAARQHAREAHEVVPNVPLPVKRPAAASLPPDRAATKVAIELMRDGKWQHATAYAVSIGDPVARKLAEWALLRHSDSEAGFERYAFIRTNPDWPSIRLLRRRAEARLWQERHDGTTVRQFFREERQFGWLTSRAC